MTNKNLDIEKLREEAIKHTDLASAMKKHSFAQSFYDHIVRGGTPADPRMWEHKATPLIDLMDDEEVEQRIEDAINFRVMGRQTREDVETSIKKNIARENETWYETRTMLYLNSIGRLPEKYKDFLPQEEGK